MIHLNALSNYPFLFEHLFRVPDVVAGCVSNHQRQPRNRPLNPYSLLTQEILANSFPSNLPVNPPNSEPVLPQFAGNSGAYHALVGYYLTVIHPVHGTSYAQLRRRLAASEETVQQMAMALDAIQAIASDRPTELEHYRCLHESYRQGFVVFGSHRTISFPDFGIASAATNARVSRAWSINGSNTSPFASTLEPLVSRSRLVPLLPLQIELTLRTMQTLVCQQGRLRTPRSQWVVTTANAPIIHANFYNSPWFLGDLADLYLSCLPQTSRLGMCRSCANPKPTQVPCIQCGHTPRVTQPTPDDNTEEE